MSDRVHLEPGPDHPITVDPTGSHVTVKFGDTVLAETDDALTLQETTYPPIYYVPLADVDEALLHRTETTTYCPYKGDAGYYSVAGPDGTSLTDAVWFYEQPYPAVSEIAGHVAFQNDKIDVAVG